MATTIKAVILKHHKKEDGTYNVKIRLTHERKQLYIPTTFMVSEIYLDENLNIIDRKLKNIIDKEVLLYRDNLLSIGELSRFDAKSLAKKLSELAHPKIEYIDYLAFMKCHYEEMKLKGRSSYENYRAAYNKLYEFSKGRLEFKEITSTLLLSFEKYLIKNGVGMRGIALYMSCIRSVFNEGRLKYNDEDYGIVKISNYPFIRYKLPKIPEARQKAAGVDVVISIINYQPKNETEQLAKDMFLLSFYLIGMNAKDIFSCKTKVKDNRITYQRSKTKDGRIDKAEISVNIEPEILELIGKYLDKDNKYTFNIYKRFANSKNFNMSLSDGFISIRDSLGIDNLTMYSARHSWATIASHNCNIIDSHIAKCLNHASIDFRVTNKYIKRDWSLIDKCNRQVIDFVNENLNDKSKSIKSIF
ncbi:site-specific integrase [Dysgonomonas sp. Marseille-P4677]|uniref:tyrosine-type recombinase/integrase n=1 Tax=Dysgonomonas sp. Marseille-P4677 TaxID=2364790 RepID=UPI0019146C5F|nr:site-specific integrase [Dysgonomonas sp. Marseille-P4677]MBK5723076.1 site-specific integrase [Dysgonomonas sp. Marseille-P4677]